MIKPLRSNLQDPAAPNTLAVNRTGPLQTLAVWLVAAITLVAWLWLWQLLVGAAQWFGLALALTAVLSFLATLPALPLGLKKGLTAFGTLCAGLAIFTALSLGAFLPFEIADFLSPALGRFGGAGSLGLLALLFMALAFAKRQSGFIDLALFCATGAIWVAINTAAQSRFPPAPYGKAEWAGLLWLLFWLGLATGIVAIVLLFFAPARWPVAPLRRWAIAATLLGFVLAFFFGQGEIATFCILLLVALLITFALLGWRFRTRTLREMVAATPLQALAVVFVILALGGLYFSTAEQLETVLARNTLERYAQKSWWWLFGENRFPEQRGLTVTPGPTGAISGLVLDESGQPLTGANVVVADAAGYAWTALSGPDGRYNIANIKPGHYLPVVARAGYLDVPATGNGPLGDWRMVASVRGGQTAPNINFKMPRRAEYRINPGNTLKLEEFTETFRDNPVDSPALRRVFNFENEGLSKSGLVYEPMPERGPGPFPILLIVYPGPANAWEGVSIPLAAQGFVVIAYQPELFGPHPERGLNLNADVSDMLQLYNYAKAGQFSQRGDPQKVIVTGGSVSTVYTYLVLRELENSPAAEKAAIKGGIKYGGLADMYRYRYDWDRGALYIDPGIQDLEDMLIAFGRPDLRPEIYMRFSPVYHLERGSLPPMLIVHTTKDTIVPVIQTELLAASMERLNIPHQLIIYPDIEHYLDMSKRDPAQLDMLYKTIDFLKEVTK